VTRRVTLPLVAPAITGGALLAAVESLALFGPQAFLGSPAKIVFLTTRIYGVIGAAEIADLRAALADCGRALSAALPSAPALR